MDPDEGAERSGHLLLGALELPPRGAGRGGIRRGAGGDPAGAAGRRAGRARGAPVRMTSVLWRGPDGSLERCTLVETRAGARLAGTVLMLAAGAPLEMRYAVDVNRYWLTTRAEIRVT